MFWWHRLTMIIMIIVIQEQLSSIKCITLISPGCFGNILEVYQGLGAVAGPLQLRSPLHEPKWAPKYLASYRNVKMGKNAKFAFDHEKFRNNRFSPVLQRQFYIIHHGLHPHTNFFLLGDGQPLINYSICMSLTTNYLTDPPQIDNFRRISKAMKGRRVSQSEQNWS